MRIFGSKREKISSGWREFYYVIHNLYFLTATVKLIKFWRTGPAPRDRLEDLGVDGRN